MDKLAHPPSLSACMLTSGTLVDAQAYPPYGTPIT